MIPLPEAAQHVRVFGEFAIIALVTSQMQGTATGVARVLVSSMAPMAIVSPQAGVFVERWHWKRTLIASDRIRGVLVLSLVFVCDLNRICAILFTTSVVSAFCVPVQSVAVVTLVPLAGRMAVNGLMSQAQRPCPGRRRTTGTACGRKLLLPSSASA